MRKIQKKLMMHYLLSYFRSDDTARSEIEVEPRSEAEITEKTMIQAIPRKNS